MFDVDAVVIKSLDDPDHSSSSGITFFKIKFLKSSKMMNIQQQ